MKKPNHLIMLFSVFYFFTSSIYAQTIIKGTVEDPKFNESLIGANIIVQGTNRGTVTDYNGNFELQVESAEKVDILISYVGYDEKVLSVDTREGIVNLGTIFLKQNAISVLEINIIADRAKERETPVAFSTIRKKDIEDQLGSRDIPMILNVTPSVYATQQGGGAGDARINVRGFDQQNVAIMINGVPVNDMENGWVYWSNWDGIADATSSIQLQRGLSAVNLATPSIGGTMNILTSPAEHDAGGDVKFEYGSGNFMKSTISAHSGMINNKFALSASVVRKVGDGVIDRTWTDAWAYYVGASFVVNKDHRLELFAMGAPQRHGQNSYMQNVAAYSHEYASELGADAGTLDAFPESDEGRLYNENWNYVSNYSGKQFWNGKEHDRYNNGFINERENYFHKPLINMNWYARWADNISQYTTVYYSGGKGGGSGTYGSISYDRDSEPSQIIDWDQTIANATSNTWEYQDRSTDTTLTQLLLPGQAVGALRNSVNEQWTIGALSKVRIDFTENFRGSFGIDWRTAEIDHFREIRDLLGGEFFSPRDANGDRIIKRIEENGDISYLFYDESEFWQGNDYQRGLGDKVGYHFTNTVDWFGYFVQGEFSNDIFSAYGTVGHSLIKYGYTNHFVEDENNPGQELQAESDYLAGYQFKGGFSFRPMENLNIFANGGYISKSPIFDNVINDETAVVTEDPKNEKFLAFEAGASYLSPLKNIEIKANYYITRWTDRANLRRITNQDGSEGYVFLSGMAQLHHGFELEGTYKPVRYIAVGGFASIGNWKYTDNVVGTYKDYNSGTEVVEKITYFVDGLKVGDAPQTQFGLIGAIYPLKNLRFQADFRHNSNYYANWDPFTRTDENDRGQVWKTPSYYLVDLHASYRFALTEKIDAEVFGHIFNLLDEIYIQDATDNSQYNGFYDDDRFSHDVNTAEVYVGLPRTFNIGVKVTF